MKKSVLSKIYLLVFFIVIIMLILYFAVLSQNFKMLFNPFTKVEQLSDIKENEWIEFKSKQLEYSGYVFEEDNKVKGYYVVSEIKIDKSKDYDEDNTSFVLILLSNSDEGLVDARNTVIKGKVEKFGSIEEDLIFNELGVQRGSITTLFIKTGTNHVLIMIIGYALIALMLFLAYKIIILAMQVKNYKLSKAYKNFVNTYGEAEVENIEAGLNRDMETSRVIEINKRSVITDTAVLISLGGDCFLRKTSDLIWAYKTTTKHYTNGIPSGKTYGMAFCFADGYAKSINMKNQKSTDALVEVISSKYPYLIIGFTDEVAGEFRTNREAMIAHVNDRKNGLNGK